MPVPKPNAGEKKKDFISRCIGVVTTADPERPDDQRAAMCYTAWDDAKSKGEVMGNGEEEVLVSLGDAADSDQEETVGGDPNKGMPSKAAGLHTIEEIKENDLLSDQDWVSIAPEQVMLSDVPEFEPLSPREDIMNSDLSGDLANRLKKIPTDGNNLAS